MILVKLKKKINFLKNAWRKIIDFDNRENYIKTLRSMGADVFEGVSVYDVEIGYGSYIATNSIVHNCLIKRYCSIGPNCTIGYGKHPMNLFTTSSVLYKNMPILKQQIVDNCIDLGRKVVIEDDVWIGANVFINSGVKIGRGAIIGAGSIVLKDVPKYEIHVGNPAKKLRDRFENEIISILERSLWWELEIDDLNSELSDKKNSSPAFFELRKIFDQKNSSI